MTPDLFTLTRDESILAGAWLLAQHDRFVSERRKHVLCTDERNYEAVLLQMRQIIVKLHPALVANFPRHWNAPA